ncbi:hypothetical protein SDC9_189359 [bioreactor metagenome]|uniref:Uncharacterized protein n=1 Tax=bioreactor metagenome TaxID=1076179 RepID=A0A645I060_9ZZZZ
MPDVLTFAGKPAVWRDGEVVPEDVDLAKLGKELLGLMIEVLDIAFEVSFLVTGDVFGIFAHGVAVVDGIVGVVPVKEGMVEADL